MAPASPPPVVELGSSTEEPVFCGTAVPCITKSIKLLLLSSPLPIFSSIPLAAISAAVALGQDFLSIEPLALGADTASIS